MLTDVSCRQVFLASPSGLDAERKRCRKVFRQHNESRALAERAFFYVHAWEEVAGGVGRPQDLVNPRLDECDYVVMLFHDRWGSPPAGDGDYTSGTEEEFYRALDRLGDADSPMRDILVLFKTVNPDRITDAGPALKAVLDFRAGLEASKSLMYGTFDSDAALRRVLERKMRKWLDDRSPKEARSISIPRAHVDTARLRITDANELLASARAYAAEGLLMQAEAAFAGATERGEPETMLEFGQFMRRTGRLEQAMALNRRVASEPQLLVTGTAHAVRLRVKAMSNVGVIQRQLGELTESIHTLGEAVRTADASREPVPEEQCYALDNYAFSLLRAGKARLAREQFERVGRIRAEFGTKDDRLQSAINLGRYHSSQLEFDEALGHFERALQMLHAGSDQHLRGNAEAGKAEALLRLGRDSEVDGLLDSALSINEDLHNKRGSGIVHGLWARTLLIRHLPDEAEGHIATAGALAEETGDVQGQAVVAWLRADFARQNGDLVTARVLAAEAEGLVSDSADIALRRDLRMLLETLQAV